MSAAEQYTNELVTAIREKSTDEFRKKFRNVDMLLVDDVQFFAGKEQIEENFFYTFNELHSSNRQIVVASGPGAQVYPADERAFTDRFEWGLVADLQQPDFATRLGILQHKAQRDDIHDQSRCTGVHRAASERKHPRAGGSLNRVVAYSKLLNTAVTPESPPAHCAILPAKSRNWRRSRRI